VEINIGVAGKNSDSAADAIANFPVTFEDGKTYVVIANGIVGGNPDFNLDVFDMGQELANDEDNVGLLFFHDSLDAPAVDVLVAETPVIDNASNGGFQGYLNIPADDTYILDITPADDNSTFLASYEADFSWWDGKTAVIFASGFLSNDPAFEPWVALNTGGTFPLDLATTLYDDSSPDPIIEIGNSISTFSVKPNPATEFIQLNIPIEQESIIRLDILNMLGARVKTISYGLQQQGILSEQIDVSDILSGTYFINIQTNGQRFDTPKLIITK